MSDFELPFREGTKKYDIANKIVQGEDLEKIIRDGKHSKTYVYGVRKKLVDKGILVPKEENHSSIPQDSAIHSSIHSSNIMQKIAPMEAKNEGMNEGMKRGISAEKEESVMNDPQTKKMIEEVYKRLVASEEQKGVEPNKSSPFSNKPKYVVRPAGLPKDNDGEGDKDSEIVSDAVERELMIKASPLIKKVMLNPEFFFWYDYAKSNLDFRGDEGDFVCDCVRYMFRNHGYQLQVTKTDDVGGRIF